MTVFETPEAFAAAKTASEFEAYCADVNAQEDQRKLETALTAALAAHRDACAVAHEQADTAIGKALVRIAKAIVDFRDALEELNAGEAAARKAALAAHAELYPGAKRTSTVDLFGGKEHAQPVAAGHTVARILDRIQREHDISLPEKYWSQI